MASIIFLLSLGSAILAVIITMQVKVIEVNFLSIARYNLFVLPGLFLANLCIGFGLSKGHELYGNLPLWIAVQTFFYYVIITALSILVLGDKISLGKTILAFSMIIVAVYLLKS